MAVRMHAPSAGRRSGAAPHPRSPLPGVLALQQRIGNRAVGRLVGRRALARDASEIIQIGGERVRVSSAGEKGDAERIVKDMKANYGVAFDSIAARRTTRAYYADAVTEEQLRAVDVAPWEYTELQAVERALKHFAPVLGDARKKSTLASSPQEIVSMGKLTTAPDDDPKKIGDRSRGEYFTDDRTFAMYQPGPDSNSDPERTATHELAHGIFAPQLDAFMKATGYWKAKYVKSKAKGAEGPPDGYADTNASEDLAQSVMYFFVDPERLKKGDGKRAAGTWGNPCPRRFRFIQQVVGGWTPARKRP